MDAAYTTLKKAVLFLSFTLVSLGFWSSPANAQTIVTCGSVQLTSQNFQVPCAVYSTGADITYTSSVVVSGGDPAGWVSLNPSSGTVTSASQNFVVQLQNTAGLSGGTHTATIRLTPTAPAGRDRWDHWCHVHSRFRRRRWRRHRRHYRKLLADFLPQHLDLSAAPVPHADHHQHHGH